MVGLLNGENSSVGSLFHCCLVLWDIMWGVMIDCGTCVSHARVVGMFGLLPIGCETDVWIGGSRVK